jgi:hypothetical protein
MASDRPKKTLADYVALAVSPALIMALVGSLVFFLLEVLYRGAYEGRLQWILFFFVFGAVLIARISMTDAIAGRAGLYGLVLGGLVWLGMGLFVKYPEGSLAAGLRWPLNLGLIALVWWCAHRLTRDCTQIDEDGDASGAGLLQAAGLDNPSAEPGARSAGRSEDEEKLSEPESWSERYRRFQEERKRKRVLGLWVVYFSLAALPLFGLGQALIPVQEAGRRRYAFWLMTVYVGSGLGLLMTTCFLGLRRYLRQRKLQMPAAMTGAWLTAGAVLIVLLLAAGALLPRPAGEYAWFPIQPLGSEKRKASRLAVKGDSTEEGKGTGGKDKSEGKRGQAGNQGKREKGPGKGQKDKSGSGGKDGKNGGGEKDREAKGGKGKDRDAKGGNEDQQAKGREASGQAQDPQGDDQEGEEGDSSSAPDSSSSSSLAEFQRKVGPVLKWLVFGILALVVLFVLLRNGLQYLANFSNWARDLLAALRNFWASLFGGGGGGDDESGAEVEAGFRVTPSMPFSSFHNPFAGGAARWSPQELMRYTFAALEAWAREHGQGRQPGETPIEFGERLGRSVPALAADVRRLVALYVRAAYARGGVLPAGSAEVVRQFWERLEAAAATPLSA